MTTERAPANVGRFVFSVFLMLLGILFTLGNLGLFSVRRYVRYWPVVLIVIGLWKLLERRPSGFVWLVLGSWFLGHNLGLIPISIWKLWPGAPIFIVGAALAWGALRPRRPPEEPSSSSATSGNTASMFALMGGVEEISHAKAFRGGDITAIMGGCGLDLRQAVMADGEAVIEAFALMGGIEIKVPEDWQVVCRGLPVMGGMESTAKAPKGEAGKRLVVNGVAIMGGIEVKN
jgi:predicted membrane protein